MNWDSSPCLAFQCTGSAAPEGGSWWWGWASVILVSKRLQHGIKMLDGGCTQRWHSSSWPWHLLQTWVGFDSHVFINMILNDSWTNIVSMCGGNYTPYIQDGRVAVTFKKLFAETTHLPGGHGLTTFIVLLVHLLKLGYQQLHMPWLVTRHWNHYVEADMVQHQVFSYGWHPLKCWEELRSHQSASRIIGFQLFHKCTDLATLLQHRVHEFFHRRLGLTRFIDK